MAIIKSEHAGVVLAGSFNRSSPSYQQEAQEFVAKLTGLQKELGFSAFVPIAKEDGGLLKVYIIPASAAAPGATDGKQFKDDLVAGKIKGDAFEVSSAARGSSLSDSDRLAQAMSQLGDLGEADLDFGSLLKQSGINQD